ncbi:MAG: chemotaxis protein CheW [Fimbriiglobus sp.]
MSQPNEPEPLPDKPSENGFPPLRFDADGAAPSLPRMPWELSLPEPSETQNTNLLPDWLSGPTESLAGQSEAPLLPTMPWEAMQIPEAPTSVVAESKPVEAPLPPMSDLPDLDLFSTLGLGQASNDSVVSLSPNAMPMPWELPEPPKAERLLPDFLPIPSETPRPTKATELPDDELKTDISTLSVLFPQETENRNLAQDLRHDWAAAATVVQSSGPEDQYILFQLGKSEYVLDLSHIVEIGPRMSYAPLPYVPDWFLGLTNLRGDVVSVVDLRLFLGYTPMVGRQERVIIVKDEQGSLTGLLVDGIRGMRRIPSTAPRSEIEGLETTIAPYLSEIIDHEKRLLAVFDIPRLLASEEFLALQAEAVA